MEAKTGFMNWLDMGSEKDGSVNNARKTSDWNSKLYSLSWGWGRKAPFWICLMRDAGQVERSER